jgi:hypothetical protein
MLPKVTRLAVFAVNIKQRLQPLRAQALSISRSAYFWRLDAIRRLLLAVRFVKPMRSNAAFSDHMHRLGAHLKFHIHTAGSHHGSV